uniref:DUF4435 domain-containing protein n=1 Tax=Ascaris lumbricoides TaxID=6252 RepID=A0A0M3I205_ASCLU
MMKGNTKRIQSLYHRSNYVVYTVIAQIAAEQMPDSLFGKPLTIQCGDKTDLSYPYFDFQTSYDYLGLCFIRSKCQPLLESLLKINDIHGEYSKLANFSFFYMENPDPEFAAMQIGRRTFCRLHSVELRRLKSTNKSHERIAMSWRMHCSDSDSMKTAYILSMRACGMSRIVYEISNIVDNIKALGFKAKSELESIPGVVPPVKPSKPFEAPKEQHTYKETNKQKGNIRSFLHQILCTSVDNAHKEIFECILNGSTRFFKKQAVILID